MTNSEADTKPITCYRMKHLVQTDGKRGVINKLFHGLTRGDDLKTYNSSTYKFKEKKIKIGI